jgi:hypothetical protein
MIECRYRTLTQGEENKRERWLAERALKVFSQMLKLPLEVRLSFIEPDSCGPHAFQIEGEEVLGFCHLGGREILIRRGLPIRDLVLVVAHECRHSYQKQNRKFYPGDSAERDARIFELEVNPPQDHRILRWLADLQVELSPKLREIYQITDRLLQHSKPNQTSAQRSHEITNRVAGRIYTTTQERITYIRNLLQRLPNSPAYSFQRANLAEELSDLTREEII